MRSFLFPGLLQETVINPVYKCYYIGEYDVILNVIYWPGVAFYGSTQFFQDFELKMMEKWFQKINIYEVSQRCKCDLHFLYKSYMCVYKYFNKYIKATPCSFQGLLLAGVLGSFLTGLRYRMYGLLKIELRLARQKPDSLPLTPFAFLKEWRRVRNV